MLNTPPVHSSRWMECRWSGEEEPVNADLGRRFWKAADWQAIATQWDGEPVDPRWHTSFASRWTAEFLYFGFHADFEGLTMVDQPIRQRRTQGLWTKEDVVEVFLGPDLDFPDRYKEFELSPSAQWIEIDLDRSRSFSDFEWICGMESRSVVDHPRKHWQAEFRVPLRSLGLKGSAVGALFAMNAYRVELKSNLYLAWNPTLSPKPDFHVPARFGRMLLSR
jgi:alpha-galactosidase